LNISDWLTIEIFGIDLLMILNAVGLIFCCEFDFIIEGRGLSSYVIKVLL